MSNTNQGQAGQQADPDLALKYLAEVASSYAQTLDSVVRGPFINQVNICTGVLGRAIAPDTPKKPAKKA